jgi:hypothetical protein
METKTYFRLPDCQIFKMLHPFQRKIIFKNCISKEHTCFGIKHIWYGHLLREGQGTCDSRSDSDTCNSKTTDRDMDVSYICSTYFCCLTYSTVWQERNSVVMGQSDLTERYATELFLLPASHFTYSSTLKMEAIRSPEVSVDFYQTTWHYIPEESTHKNLFCMFLQGNPE